MSALANVRRMDIAAKVRAIMAATKWKQMRLAEEAGVSQSTVFRWLNGSEPEGASRDRIDELYRLFVTSNAEGPSHPLLRTVTVSAYVQAGHWEESWEWEDDLKYPVAVPAVPALEGYKLYAAETKGPSMNRRWPEGTVVVFTNVEETKEPPTPGKRYVVEKRRLGGDAEHTVKLLHVDAEGKYWLVPESDDPRFQAPISVDDGSDEADVVVSIIGRVWFAVSRE